MLVESHVSNIVSDEVKFRVITALHELNESNGVPALHKEVLWLWIGGSVGYYAHGYDGFWALALLVSCCATIEAALIGVIKGCRPRPTRIRTTRWAGALMGGLIVTVLKGYSAKTPLD